MKKIIFLAMLLLLATSVFAERTLRYDNNERTETIYSLQDNYTNYVSCVSNAWDYQKVILHQLYLQKVNNNEQLHEWYFKRNVVRDFYYVARNYCYLAFKTSKYAGFSGLNGLVTPY